MMSNVKMVDARGLSCPEPVLLTNKAISKLSGGTIEVLVDSGTARENVSRLAKSSGWSVIIDEQPDGSSKMVLNK